MLKPYLFASLYIVVGVIGWQAYSAITNNNTSVDALKEAATTVMPAAISESFDRWSETQENTPQSINAAKIEKYEKELELLRRLPQEALPVPMALGAPKAEDKTLLEQLPDWSDVSDKFQLPDDLTTLRSKD